MEFFRQALAASKKGNHKKALELLDKAAALNPMDPDIFNNRGNAYNNLGDQQKALADYNMAVSLRPGDAAALSNRGLAHERMGDDVAACRDYRAACDLGDCNFFDSFKKEGRCPK
ncbi:tetratricopeptide repeat protein [Desulfovibrio sulfodismutans]|uniref:Tetratricopeptide repeat protein n=2 Tax=Desulfolutivibrio sulfodismutans TaxID=63561 RepID=A0A7K3NIE2_9BACT|nr:tetratricopeptide repeat protein [Desulfolutivibrio sulfodismutans]NDY55958.1 tetratricopeptide repeat protein [Desulfolutivibrio sulfodismutans]QLA11219.1 tetratricopeptide repeat protein [Desulfolutivibrio sulfodismutans DSM 3696]